MARIDSVKLIRLNNRTAHNYELAANLISVNGSGVQIGNAVRDTTEQGDAVSSIITGLSVAETFCALAKSTIKGASGVLIT